MRRAFMIAGLGLLLAACADNPKAILITESSVTIRTDSWFYGGSVYHTADEICRQFNKHAADGRALSSGDSGEYWLIRYDCVAEG